MSRGEILCSFYFPAFFALLKIRFIARRRPREINAPAPKFNRVRCVDHAR
jgi:hypothetical protein